MLFLRAHMNHLPNLIHDLGLILIVAGITTLLFKWLKQPLVLGYILAGLLVGPNMPFVPTVVDTANIRIWADIGVIFLLFSLGLEFSFKKLMKVGGPASITAIVEVPIMLGVGYGLGRMLGWEVMDSIFLGGILCISSTTIILRAFDELGVKGNRFANLVFGILIVEDLVAIVLMVLLSTIAATRQFAGTEMLLSIGKLLFYLLLWFAAGIFFIPSFLRRLHRMMSDETMLIVSIGLCLMMVLLAAMAGFSPALGAFIMGSILAETTQAERIEHLVKPVKDLFGAVFFVSVGMLIDPAVIKNYALPIIIITVVFMVCKAFAVTLGATISGQPLKTALYAGMSQTQIGEFSFIIATLGVTLGVTSKFLYPIAVAISAITTFATPYMIRAGKPIYTQLDRALPVRWKKVLDRYSAGAQTISTATDWQLVIRSFLLSTFLFSVIIIGIIVLFKRYVEPLVFILATTGFWGTIITAVLTLIVLSPFLWALVVRKLQPQAFASLWANKKYRGPLVLIRLMRTMLGVAYIGFLLQSFFSFYVALVTLIIVLLLALVFSKKLHAVYLRVEDRFFTNFNSRELQAAANSLRELAPWDAHISQYTIPAGAACTGKTLKELGLREQFGVNIAMIKRGEHYSIPAPDRFEKLYPDDSLYVIGTDEQLEAFRKYIQLGAEPSAPQTADVVLKSIRITESSSLLGKNIRESGIRDTTNGLVVGIERNRRRMLNPESTEVFEQGDKVWIVGDERLIAKLA